MVNLDNLDKKIICILENDCRHPVSNIAKNLKKDRNTISYRINKLKEKGIIKRNITSINLGNLGYNSYKIYFNISSINNLEKELIEFICQNKQIIHLIKLEGEYNLSCVIATKNIVKLDMFLTEIKTKFKKIIKKIHISIVVYSKIFKFEKLLLNNKNQPLKIEKFSSQTDKIKLDKTDKQILHALSQNANMSYIKLTKKTGLTLDIIKYRMKQLKKIVNFRLLPDLEKIGYFHFVILIATQNMTKKDEQSLMMWTALEKNVMYCTKRIGLFDIEINVAIKNIKEYRNLLNKLIQMFSNIIDTYDTVIVDEIIKLDYMPF